MASRTQERINLPQASRQSVPVTGIPQVNIPLMDGKAKALSSMGNILNAAGTSIAEIDRKNQEMAAEKTYTDTLLAAQREINEARDSFTGDEDMTAATLGIYDRYIADVQTNTKNSIQAEYITKKLTAQRDSIGMMALDYELKFKAKKYDADLTATIENSANIVAGDPRLFKAQLKGVEDLIANSRLDGLEKTEKLTAARQMMGQVYFTRLSELNPAKARAEINSAEMNAIIDPKFKVSLLGKLDAEQKAKASLALQDDIKSIEQARKMGIAVPQEFITQTAQRARAAGNERTAAGLEKYAGLQEYSVGFSQKPLADQQFEIRELQTKAKLGDLTDLDRLELAQETYKDKLTAIKSDPWNYYADKGIIAPETESLIDKDAASASLILRQRRESQEKVSQLEGKKVRLPLLTPQEVGQLSAMKDATDPKQLAATLVSIGSSMSGAERRSAVALVAAKEPMLAVAMGQDYDSAARLLAGRTAKGEVTEAKVREKVTPMLNGVTLDGAVNETFHEAIYSTYKQLALEKGETSKEAQTALLEQAVRDTVGEIGDVNIGKPSRVIIPAGMTAWQVEDRLNSLTDDVLKTQLDDDGVPYGQLPKTSDGFRATAADIMRFGRFMSAGDGVVAVQFPTGVLTRDDGKPYTIDLNAIKEISPYRRKPNALLQIRTGGADAGQ
ncbi:MAG: hypothetical protein ACK502_10825 [Alphaproteobacteria bacterium]